LPAFCVVVKMTEEPFAARHFPSLRREFMCPYEG